VTVSACESTAQESARIGREGKQSAASAPGALKLGAVNHGVRVSDVTLLSGSGRAAVAVRLTGTSPHPQANVPVLVNVTGTGGRSVYSNATGGLEPSLQRVTLLRPQQAEWWVDDQVLTSRSVGGVKVRVGTGRELRSGSPAAAVETAGVHLGQQGGLSVLSGKIINRSAGAVTKLPVFAVALRGGHVVAAGRAVVNTLAGPSGASAPFQIFLVGNPTGASIELTVVPAAG
jgi:hypothetical protein